MLGVGFEAGVCCSIREELNPLLAVTQFAQFVPGLGRGSDFRSVVVVATQAARRSTRSCCSTPTPQSLLSAFSHLLCICAQPPRSAIHIVRSIDQNYQLYTVLTSSRAIQGQQASRQQGGVSPVTLVADSLPSNKDALSPTLQSEHHGYFPQRPRLGRKGRRKQKCIKQQ